MPETDAESEFNKLTDIVFRAALCEHEALNIWAQNLPVFQKMLGEVNYWQVICCIRGIFLRGIDRV